MELSELEQSQGKENTQSPKKINIRNVKFEKIIPLFTGLLGSLILCAFVASQTDAFGGVLEKNTTEALAQLSPEAAGSFFLTVSAQVEDPILEYFRTSDYKVWVIEFFTDITSNREIATVILRYSDEYNVPPALAFALSWEESKFNPRAVNRFNRDGSIDRGLFQLNNSSFPHMELNSFFDINTNARYGIGHLKHCLDIGGTVVVGLAMYNAGSGRVNTSGAPKVTLNYISRIMENRSKIENRFNEMLLSEKEVRLAEEERAAAQQTPLQINRTLITTSPQ